MLEGLSFRKWKHVLRVVFGSSRLMGMDLSNSRRRWDNLIMVPWKPTSYNIEYKFGKALSSKVDVSRFFFSEKWVKKSPKKMTGRSFANSADTLVLLVPCHVFTCYCRWVTLNTQNWNLNTHNRHVLSLIYVIDFVLTLNTFWDTYP